MPDATTEDAGDAPLTTTRDAVFAWHPDPWKAAARLEYGADRSLAHVIENQVLTAPPAAYKSLERSLVALLGTPGATLAGKDFACRMLAIVGSDACVPTVEPLLRAPETEHLARMVLENLGTTPARAALQRKGRATAAEQVGITPSK